ncbi:MAG: TIGR04282 family arsenosugar biosynthesis glycosyltransferase [Bryobacteraceae bacterium]|nr:TIGR04282 family arsenosugar biosynthesis glycosyltransferase [Bryobacteraceae bacterium]
MDPTRIAIFAKAPVPGRVKTRLIPPLTPESAAALHQAFVRDVLLVCERIPDAVPELWTDIDTDAWDDLNVARKLQIPGDLGLKMLHAAECGLKEGAGRVVIVGADCPTLPATHLRTAASSDCDIAITPAEDGGYCAIGFRRTHPAMFDGVEWSSSDALSGTIRACQAAGLTVSLGPFWYDIDTPADLARLELDPLRGEATQAWFMSQARRISPAER